MIFINCKREWDCVVITVHRHYTLGPAGILTAFAIDLDTDGSEFPFQCLTNLIAQHALLSLITILLTWFFHGKELSLSNARHSALLVSIISLLSQIMFILISYLFLGLCYKK